MSCQLQPDDPGPEGILCPASGSLDSIAEAAVIVAAFGFYRRWTESLEPRVCDSHAESWLAQERTLLSDVRA